ncbi:Transcription elongation factor B polypeptide 2 [Melipona quadrifasciata]|uniref:Elongin-B n=1 Tax=Melipona quadrifasciata TaxID=166423 RepID=A0A0N0BBR6_9HYME|nr:Transcription elongation factor B polypeptide 2 [Melipona quadrifasciata]
MGEADQISGEEVCGKCKDIPSIVLRDAIDSTSLHLHHYLRPTVYKPMHQCNSGYNEEISDLKQRKKKEYPPDVEQNITKYSGYGKIGTDVFLMIRRKNMTIFTDAKDNTTVLELKKIIEGILKIPPVNQQLFNKDNVLMSDSKFLSDYGLTSATAKPQCPALVGLAVRQENGQFEPLEMTPFSLPPDLPDVMKSQEANGQEQSP